MNIRSNDRVIFLGKTGSGKTYLAKKLIKQYKRVVVYDAKHELGELTTEDYITSNLSELKEIIQEHNFLTVYQPFDLDKESFDGFCKTVFNRGNLTLFFDEISYISLTQEGYFNKILRMGRSRGIGCWLCAQRPSWIDQFILSEAEHYFIFQMQLKADRQKICGVLGEEAEDKINSLKKYHFLYFNYHQGFFQCNPI